MPLVADIHFQPQVAMLVAEAFEKIRINPGNFVDGRKKFDVINYDDPKQFDAEREHIREVRNTAGNGPERQRTPDKGYVAAQPASSKSGGDWKRWRDARAVAAAVLSASGEVQEPGQSHTYRHQPWLSVGQNPVLLRRHSQVREPFHCPEASGNSLCLGALPETV